MTASTSNGYPAPGKLRRVATAILRPKQRLRYSTALWFLAAAILWTAARYAWPTDLPRGKGTTITCWYESGAFSFDHLPEPDPAAERWTADLAVSFGPLIVNAQLIPATRFTTGTALPLPTGPELQRFRRALADHIRLHAGDATSFWGPAADAQAIAAAVASDSGRALHIQPGELVRAALIYASATVMLISVPLGLARATNATLIRRRLKRAERRLCPACNYDLSGSFPICPECGADYRAEVRRLDRVVGR